MGIKTKYNIGDRVYFMHNNKVDNMCINSIKIVINPNINDIHCEPIVAILYFVEGSYAAYLEEELFSSKEELINSL